MMYLVLFLVAGCIAKERRRESDVDDLQGSDVDRPLYRLVPTTAFVPAGFGFEGLQTDIYPLGHVQVGLNTQPTLLETVPQDQHEQSLQTALASNPLLAALFLSSSLGIQPTARGFNHPQHLPINPYVALLLSHYGKYINAPFNRLPRGLYGYAAANNLHNNQPFGSYKVHEDQR